MLLSAGMDDFEDPLADDDKFDSLDETLGALAFALADELHEITAQIEDARTARRRDDAKLSRLAGYEIACQYALGQFLEMRDRFSDTGMLIRALHDDPAYLPGLMDEVLAQMKTRHADGRLLKSAMVLLPSTLPEITLDRAAVSKGLGEALQWLETDLFPLFKHMCPTLPPEEPPFFPPLPPPPRGPAP